MWSRGFDSSGPDGKDPTPEGAYQDPLVAVYKQGGTFLRVSGTRTPDAVDPIL